MKPILRARLSASDVRGLMLDCGDGMPMRIVALAEDLVRITLLRGGEVRQKRTWSVPAYGEADTDWAGRAGSTTRRGRRSRPRSRRRPTMSCSPRARCAWRSRSTAFAWTGRCPMERSSRATARRSPIFSGRRRMPSGTRWRARRAIVTMASATRPARSTSPGGGSAARCAIRSASIPSAAIRSIRTGRS